MSVPGVAPNQPCPETLVVLGGDFDRVGFRDDVIVGEHIAPARIDDHAGAACGHLTRLFRHGWQVEEPPEEGIVEKRVLARPTRPHRNIDHAGRDLAEHGCQRWYRRLLAYGGYGQRDTADDQSDGKRMGDWGEDRGVCSGHVSNTLLCVPSCRSASVGAGLARRRWS